MNRYLEPIDWVNIRASKLLLIAMLLLPSHAGRAELEDDVTQPDPVHACGIKLLREAGKTGPETVKLPALYSRASNDKDTEFLMHMLAVIYVESAFNKQAKSQAEAHGLMQMTEIAVKDAAKHCNIKPVSVSNLFDSYTNVKYGTCYLGKLLQDMNGDWERALVTYNGGYAQLQKYDRGETIASETANYVLKVRRAIKLCREIN